MNVGYVTALIRGCDRHHNGFPLIWTRFLLDLLAGDQLAQIC